MGSDAGFEGSEPLGVHSLGLQPFGEVEFTRIELYADGVAFGWQNREWRSGWAPDQVPMQGEALASLALESPSSHPRHPRTPHWVRLRQGGDPAEISLSGVW